MKRNIVHLLLRTLATVFCVAGVPLLIVGLVRWFFDVPLSAFRPFLNDEVAYWHQTLTFSEVGFRGGYYTLGELTNPSGFTPFGPHGPGFAVAYGLFGSVFGWHRHTPVVLNLAAISTATWVWLALSRLRTSRMLLSGVLVLTFWPMILWVPTGMQEALHDAGAIVLAGFFAYALASTPTSSGPGRIGPVLAVAGWTTLVVLSLIRPTWLLLLPLWALATSRTRRRRWMIAAVGCSVVIAAVLVRIYSLTTAPFPTGFFFLRVLDFSAGMGAIWNNLRFNLARTVDLGEYTPLEVVLRVQYWGWLAGIFAVLAVAGRRWVKQRRTSEVTYLFVAALAASIALVVMLLLYTLTNRAEQRVLSAFLLFAALLCVAAPGRAAPWLATALVVSNLATTKLFLERFDVERHENFVWDRRGLYELSDAIDGHVVYRPNLSRWCNTLLTSQYPPHLIAVPAGIGISVVREPDELTLPPRSYYLLLDESARANFKGPIRTQEIARLPYGTLYRNLDSGCE